MTDGAQKVLHYRRARWANIKGKPTRNLQDLLADAHAALPTLGDRKWDEVKNSDGSVRTAAVSAEFHDAAGNPHTWYRLVRWEPNGNAAIIKCDFTQKMVQLKEALPPKGMDYTPSDALLCVFENNITLVARQYSDSRIADYFSTILRRANLARSVDQLFLDSPAAKDQLKKIKRCGVTSVHLPVTTSLKLESSDGPTSAGAIGYLMSGASSVASALLREDPDDGEYGDTQVRAELVFLRPKSQEVMEAESSRQLLDRLAQNTLDADVPGYRITLGKGGGTISAEEIALTNRATLRVQAGTVAPASGWPALSEFMVQLARDGELE